MSESTVGWLKLLNKTWLSEQLNIHPVITVSTFNKVLGMRELKYCAFSSALEQKLLQQV